MGNELKKENETELSPWMQKCDDFLNTRDGSLICVLVCVVMLILLVMFCRIVF